MSEKRKRRLKGLTEQEAEDFMEMVMALPDGPDVYKGLPKCPYCGTDTSREMAAAVRAHRWMIYSTHPAEKQHPPDPDCENCDGRGCMGCVLREYHHECKDNCPSCCADNFENTPVEVVRASDYDHLKAGLEALERWAESEAIEASGDAADGSEQAKVFAAGRMRAFNEFERRLQALLGSEGER